MHMLPSIIPDSLLAGSNSDKWAHMVATSFKKVIKRKGFRIPSILKKGETY